MENKLKVLWFTNTEVSQKSVQSSLNGDSRGWLTNLASTIYEDVDLHIAYVHPGKEVTGLGSIRNYHIQPSFYKLRLLLSWSIGVDPEGDLSCQMIKIIDDVQPDLIHIHGSEKQFINLIPRLEQKQVMVLVSLQGIMSVIAKKYTAAYTREFMRLFVYSKGLSRTSLLPRTLSFNLKKFLKSAHREEKCLPNVDFFAGRTSWDHSISHLFNPESTYFHIDRVLKPIYYDHCWSSFNLKSETFSIHTTLSNSVYKGLDVIAEAAYLLGRSNLKFNWFVAGVDEKSWSVRAARRKLGKRYPKDSIQLLGKLDANSLVDNMLKCNLYVTASYIENSPNNLAEAMLLGMPCIATDVGGTSSYLQNRHNGILVPPGDPYALAGYIRYMAENEELAARFGSQARVDSLKRHDPKKVKETLLNTYREIMKKRKI